MKVACRLLKAKSIVTVLILFIVAMALASCSAKKAPIPFNDLLSSTDVLLQQSALTRATRSVQQLYTAAIGRDNWLQALKRAYQIAKANGDYELLRNGAALAHHAFPSADELTAILVYASLRSGRYDEAQQVSQSSPLGASWQSLSDEVKLRELTTGKNTGAAAGSSSGSESPLLSLVGSKDPGLFSRTAQLLNDKSLKLDSALLYMESGNPSEAYDQMNGLEKQFPEAYLYVAYDSHHYEKAAAQLATILGAGSRVNVALELLGADLDYLRGDAAGAFSVYSRMISSSPADSWIPFVDASTYLMRNGETSKAVDLMTSGQGLYPDNRNVAMALIQAQTSAGNGEKAKQLLAAYEKHFGESVESALLEYQLSGGAATNTTGLSSYLWEAYLKSPTNVDTARYLASYLLSVGDFKGLLELTNDFEKSNGRMEWELFYRATANAALGNLTQSLSNYQDALSFQKRWQTLYNMALDQFYLTQYGRSLDDLREARSLIGEATQANAPERARVHLLMARNLDKQGQTDDAIREATYTLGLDPSLAEAHLLLKMLESKQE